MPFLIILVAVLMVALMTVLVHSVNAQPTVELFAETGKVSRREQMRRLLDKEADQLQKRLTWLRSLRDELVGASLAFEQARSKLIGIGEARKAPGEFFDAQGRIDFCCHALDHDLLGVRVDETTSELVRAFEKATRMWWLYTLETKTTRTLVRNQVDQIAALIAECTQLREQCRPLATLTPAQILAVATAIPQH